MQEVESIKDPNLLRFIDQANSEDPKSPAKQRFDTNSVSDKPYTEFVAAQDLKDLQIQTTSGTKNAMAMVHMNEQEDVDISKIPPTKAAIAVVNMEEEKQISLLKSK